MDVVLNRNPSRALLRHGDDDTARRQDGTDEVMTAGQGRRDRKFVVGAAIGGDADFIEALRRLRLLVRLEELVRRFRYRDLNFRLIPTFYGEVAVRVVHLNGAPGLEAHP